MRRRGVLLEVRPTGHPAGAAIGVIRELSDRELHAYRAAVNLLNESLFRSPFSDLAAATEKYDQSMTSLGRRLSQDPRLVDFQSECEGLHLQVERWLSAFRRFADRTSHQLSQRYGRESPERECFIRSTNVEFDNEFAYRFLWKLRNYSDHVGRPIQEVGFGSTMSLDGGADILLRVNFDAPELLDRYEGWGEIVRSDLAQRGTFPVLETIAACQQSIERIFARTVATLGHELMAAAILVLGLESQVWPHSSQPSIGTTAKKSDTRTNFQYSHIPRDNALSAIQFVHQSETLNERLPPL